MRGERGHFWGKVKGAAYLATVFAFGGACGVVQEVQNYPTTPVPDEGASGDPPLTTETVTPLTPEAVQARLREIVHRNVRATTFWAGEGANEDNMGISNVPSAFYSDWVKHFGGVDTPDARNPENIYHPEGVTPQENPFYVAIPLSEFNELGRIPEVESWLAELGFVGEDNMTSYLKNQWVRVEHQGRVVYAQVADTGPFSDERGETDMDYIANGAPYSGTEEYGIGGIDMSPAVTLFLTGHEANDEIAIDVGQTTLEGVTWQLVAGDQVPDGPWKEIVTQSRPNWE